MSDDLRNPTTSEVEYTDEELAFMRAIDNYKRDNHRPFPNWREILRIARSLGYRKVAEPTELPVFIFNAKRSSVAQTRQVPTTARKTSRRQLPGKGSNPH